MVVLVQSSSPMNFLRTLEQLSRNHIFFTPVLMKKNLANQFEVGSLLPLFTEFYTSQMVFSPISSINSFTLSPAIQVNHPSVARQVVVRSPEEKRFLNFTRRLSFSSW